MRNWPPSGSGSSARIPQNDDAQQGASGQSGCPVKSSELSAVEFEDHSFTFGYGIFYGASDYRRLKSDYSVTVGGPTSVNVTIDYGPGHASQTRSANRRGPLYDDDGSYVWAAYHAYDTGFRTAPRPVSGRIASNQERFDKRVGLLRQWWKRGNRVPHRRLFDTDANADSGPESSRKTDRTHGQSRLDEYVSGVGRRAERGQLPSVSNRQRRRPRNSAI